MIPELVVKINSSKPIGTGYPVAEGVILTAWHVVEGLEAKNIQLEWPSFKSDAGEPCVISAREVVSEEVWQGYDIALLYCQFPDQVRQSFRLVEPLTNIPSQPDARWFSVGFPALNEFFKKDTGGLIGTDLNEQQIRLVLDNTYSVEAEIPKELDSGWAAMSGAPVFCAQSKKLFAVIVDHEKWMKKEIYAVSLPCLVKNDTSFAQLSGFQQDSSEHQETFLKLCLEFTTSISDTPLFKALADGLVDSSFETTPSDIVKSVAKNLADDPIILLEKLRLIVEPEIKRNPDVIADAKQFFCLTLGMLAARNLSPNSGCLHLLSVRTRAAVEINLAAQYQLPPDLERKVGKGVDVRDSIAGRYAIEDESFPEVGWSIDANVEAITKIIDVAVNRVDKKLSGKTPQASLDEFERDELNERLKTRRKDDVPQLIRFEIFADEKDVGSHPLMNDAVCTALQAPDYLPDLPVVRFGLGTAENEAKLRAQINEFFRVIEESPQ